MPRQAARATTRSVCSKRIGPCLGCAAAQENTTRVDSTPDLAIRSQCRWMSASERFSKFQSQVTA